MRLAYPVSPLFLACLGGKANTRLSFTALESTLFVLSLLWGIYLVKSLAFRRLARGEDKRGCICVCVLQEQASVESDTVRLQDRSMDLPLLLVQSGICPLVY